MPPDSGKAGPAVGSEAVSLASVEQQLLGLQKLCRSLKLRTPRIEGLDPIARRLEKEMDVLQQCRHTAAARYDQSLASGSSPTEFYMPVQLQGVVNNVAGIGGELIAASEAPDVVAVGRRFTSIPAASRGDVRRGTAVSSEVDVVAQHGHTWIEVKAHRPFDTFSQAWLGKNGHTKGLLQQARQQVEVAAAPCNRLRGRPPALVFHFPLGCGPDVQQELQQLGIIVTGPGPLTAQALPPPPPPPQHLNADVTTLCALVSEVTNREQDDRIRTWAARSTHWQVCMDEEAEEPVQGILGPMLAGRRLYCADSAVEQFETLVSTWGGPLEKERWLRLQSLLNIVPVHAMADTAAAQLFKPAALDSRTWSDARQQADDGSGIAPSPEPSHSQGSPPSPPAGTQQPSTHQQQRQPQPPFQPRPGDSSSHERLDWALVALQSGANACEATSATVEVPPQQQGSLSAGNTFFQSTQPPPRELNLEASRLASLQWLTPQAKAVLAVSDELQAQLLTANGRAVTVAAQQGVVLEATVHRPVWLTGL